MASPNAAAMTAGIARSAKFSVCGALLPEELDELTASARSRASRPRTILFDQGGAGGQRVQCTDGIVRLYKSLPDDAGRRGLRAAGDFSAWR